MYNSVLLLSLFSFFVQKTQARTDPLWLRYEKKLINAPYVSIHIESDAIACHDPIQQTQLQAAAQELTLGFTKMYNTTTLQVSCCGCPNDSSTTVPRRNPSADETLQFSIITSRSSDLGPEGFEIINSNSVVASTSSGLLYGTFHVLSLLQRHRGLPSVTYTSIPAMERRMWDLWDQLDGSVTRGFAGSSLLWPYALYEDSAPPPRTSVFITTCNASDPYQQWYGDTLLHDKGQPSKIYNNPTKNKTIQSCMSTLIMTDPVQTSLRCDSDSAMFYYNHSNKTLSVHTPSQGTHDPHGQVGSCLDLNGGNGPDIDLWECHNSMNHDSLHQQFDYNTTTMAITPSMDKTQCLTLDRTTPIPADNDILNPWNGQWKVRAENLFRLMKSAGLNSLSLQDVNACGPINTKSLNSTYIEIIAKNLGPLMSKWGIKPFQSVCFGAPTQLNASQSSNPLDSSTQAWWTTTLQEINIAWGGQFGGFLVKADSEGNVGPKTFNLTEADGANMISNVMLEVNPTMVVIWRAFCYVYHGEDLAKQSYDTFFQLDGKFNDNVILQIKNGPMDFQIREPMHPLLGALKKTNVMLEVQAAQEYTGQQIHMTNLVTMWKEYLEFDTKWDEHNGGPTIGHLISGGQGTNRAGLGKGMACVSNLGTFANWTGNVMASVNFYGCGRLAWDTSLSALNINTEWVDLVFPNVASTSSKAKITQMLMVSRDIYEGYQSPLGIGFMIDGNGNTNGCAPKTTGPGRGPSGVICPQEVCAVGCLQPKIGGRGAQSDHYWLNPCENYDFANYSQQSVGCYRDSIRGTGYIDFYSPSIQRELNDLSLIDEKLLLFFHNVEWDYILKHSAFNNRTVWEHIVYGHYEAVEDCRTKLYDVWHSLRDDPGMKQDPDGRWQAVLNRLHQQCNDGEIFSNVILQYYANVTGRQLPHPPY